MTKGQTTRLMFTIKSLTSMQWTGSPTTNALSVKRRISAGKKNASKTMTVNSMTRRSLSVQVVVQKECLIQTAEYTEQISSNLSANSVVPLLHGFVGETHTFEISVILARTMVTMCLGKRRVIFLNDRAKNGVR